VQDAMRGTTRRVYGRPATKTTPTMKMATPLPKAQGFTTL
jgi:hypothetical protein